MKQKIALFLIFQFSFLISVAQVAELEQFFSAQEGLTFKRIVPSNVKYVDYVIKLKQPLDHKDSTKGYFLQKIYLSHLKFNAPTVMKTAGYALGKNENEEITELLKCNQIEVEHRYFGSSTPDPIDYTYLNLEQASADLHRINEIFRTLYTNEWLSTGASKGGVSTLYYKFYYPNDVKASIAYVSPLPNAAEDQRVYTFLDSIGDEVCREQLAEFQLYLLKNRDSILPVLKSYYDSLELVYTYLSFEEAYEVAVLEFSFYFWQWEGNCNELPNINSTIKEVTAYCLSRDLMSLYSDLFMNYYSSHYYQSATEIGYYGFRIDRFKDYLQVIPSDSNYSAIFTPNKMVLKFDSSLNQSLNQWLETNGNNIIYIYGSQDTWSACAINPSNKVNSKRYILLGKNHGNATILEMNKKDKKSCLKLIKSWL